MLWSYKKPIKEGIYHVNRGDVVTMDTLEVITLKQRDYGLCDDNGVRVDEYHHTFKFRPYELMSDTELNKIGNEINE